MAAIVMGEYVLGLVPPKTHDWDKFVTPTELKVPMLFEWSCVGSPGSVLMYVV